MGGLYSHTNRSTGDTVTASMYNADHQNHIDNMIPTMLDDYSADVATMRLTTDPGESGSESLGTTLAEELRRIRFTLKEHFNTTYWYETGYGDGSNSAPTIHAQGDTNTGLYFPGADQVGLATGGTAALTIASNQAVTLSGALAANGNVTLGNAATDTLTINATIQGASPLIFEGNTGNAYETTLAVTDATADRTITLPDVTGTVITTGNLSSITSSGTLSSLTVSGASALNGNVTLGDAAADTITINGVVQGASPLIFEGATANAHETTLAITDPTADRTITLPDVTGTVITTGNLTAITGAGTLAQNLNITTGSEYRINGTKVLDATSLGSGVVASSLTSVGTLSSLTTSGAIVCGGDLTVNGTTTTVNSTTISVDDKNIELGSVASPSDTTADGGGITLKGASDKTLLWDNANDNWTSNQHLNISTGKSFKINNASVLNATTLGSAVVNSSLTGVGTIASGTWQGTAVADAYVANDLTISGGTVNNSVIGGSTPAAGTFTTLTANTSLTGTLATASQPNVTGVGTISSGTWQGTTIAVNQGGTGQTSYTNGQILIGNNSGNTLTKASITAGTGISVTPGGGSITIANTGSATLFQDADGDTKVQCEESSDEDKIRFDTDGTERMILEAASMTVHPHGTSSGNTYEMRFKELAANGTNYVGFKAPDAIAANKMWALPNADGSAGQVLKTDGSLALSWTSTETSGTGTAMAIALAG